LQVSHEDDIVPAEEHLVEEEYQSERNEKVETGDTSRELPLQFSHEDEIVPAEEEHPVEEQYQSERKEKEETDDTSRELPLQFSHKEEIVPAEEEHPYEEQYPSDRDSVDAVTTEPAALSRPTAKRQTINPEAVAVFVDKLGMKLSDAQQIVDSCPALHERSGEALAETLDFLLVELHPAPVTWQSTVQRDPQLLASPAKELADSLVWLEEFLWNQQWAVGFGRQALAEAIQHRPELLYCGEDAHFETVSWLERHGVSYASISMYVAGPTSVPFPSEPYPWLDLLQLGAERLERASVWCQSDLGWTREDVAAALKAEPNSILAAATAAGASPGSPKPRYPLPTPASDWKFASEEAVGTV